MSGTFIFFSWDIMEPIAYMMLFTNFTCGFLYYNMRRVDLQLTNMSDMLQAKFAQRLYKKKALDVEKLEQLTREVEEIRDIMNKSLH